MIERNRLEVFLNSLLNPAEFEDYVPNGLQVEGKQQVASILGSVSISENVIKEAVAQNVDAILVHHGFFWSNLPKNITGAFKKKVKLLLDHEINLFAYHLPLDFAPLVGNNEPAIRALGVEFHTSLDNIGYIGELAAPQEPSSMVERLNNYYNTQGTHIIPPGLKKIDKIAIVSGGGASYFQKAIAGGAQCFITGEGSEWVYNLCQDHNVMFSAMGHYATEKIGPKLLLQRLSHEFGLETSFYEEENPF